MKNVRKELEDKQIDDDFIKCSPLIRTKHTADLLNYKIWKTKIKIFKRT